MLKEILQLIGSIDLRCERCIFFKTPKCEFEALHNDKPCADGILIQQFKSDILFKKGEKTLFKPTRFLTADKTKIELMQTFSLDSSEIEELLVLVKIQLSQKPETPQTPKKKEPTKEDLELEQKAQELLKQKDLISKFIEHQNRFLIMDETVRKLLLLSCVSAYGDYPLNIGLMQVFSSGKTTVSIKTAQYFPNTWFLGSLSPKSLIHEKGEFNEEKQSFIIDLQKKILLFLDEPQLETLLMLKPLLSHDKFETEYRYVDKQTGQTVSSILRGWPTAIFCTTQSKYVMELCSRWFTASPETSTEKIKKVILAKGRKASQTEPENPEFTTWQKAFSILAEESPFKVIIPNANALAECFRSQKPIDMRFFDLFLALIKASTVLHAHQREKNEQNYLIATIQDYENAYKVFHQIERSTTLGLGQNVIDFFQNIITPLWQEQTIISDPTGPHLTYEDLLTKYQETFEEPISRGTLREHYLQPLENKGLIDIEDSPEDRRRKIITVKATLPETSLINNEEFKKRIATEVG